MQMARPMVHETHLSVAPREGATPQQGSTSLRHGMAGGVASCAGTSVLVRAPRWRGAALEVALVEGLLELGRILRRRARHAPHAQAVRAMCERRD